VVIVGAGTAGAALAKLCAERGLRVVVVDRGPLDAAGAHWLNAVPGRHFDEAGIARPAGEELAGDNVAFHILAGRGPERAVIRDHGVLEVDMALLVARLQRDARDAGAILEGHVRALGVDDRTLSTDRGTVRADCIVDASGLGGARLLGGPPDARGDLCAAAQDVYAIRDRAAAEAFLERHAVPPTGEVLSFAGTAGGYSVLNVRLVDDHVSLLTGSIPARGNPSGRAMMDEFVASQSWIGAPIRRASRAIPLGRPRDVLVSGRVAALGDAARQVFSAHGSGIGAGLVAARMLADALAQGKGPEAYAVRWQRSEGGLLAAYDVFRRMAQELTVEDMARLMRAGLLDEDMMRPGMTQSPPDLRPRLLARKAPAALRERRLAQRIADVGARMMAVRALYARYPSSPGRARSLWSRAAARLAG
jgi:flavin-dependent dehydrogenase